MSPPTSRRDRECLRFGEPPLPAETRERAMANACVWEPPLPDETRERAIRKALALREPRLPAQTRLFIVVPANAGTQRLWL